MAGWPVLSPGERRALLAIARRSIESAAGVPAPTRAAPSGELDPADERLTRGGPLEEPWGAFVSIHVGDDLRGCVGQIRPERALRETIRECAAAAAARDRRFPPLTAREAAQARIEISVITQPRPIGGPSGIEIGRHGLIVGRGASSGLLLPQVAAREGWDARVFLEAACRKAGLPPRDWENGASVETFEAVVFGEIEAGAEGSREK